MNLFPPDRFCGPRLRPAVAASIVFLMAAVAAAGLIWRLQKHRLQEYRLHVANVAADHAGHLQRSLDQGFSATYTLAMLVRQGKGTISDFDTIAKRMLPLYPTVSAMQLAPGGVIRQIVPLAGNEGAIGHDILNDPKRANEGRLARDSGKLTLAGPFALKQGGVGAVARLPVTLEDKQGNSYFWGFTNVLVRFPQALEQSQLAELAGRGFGYELWRIDPDSGKKQRIAASTEAAMQGTVDQRIVVPNGTWTLSVAPLAGWGNSVRLALDAGLGLLFSLLLAWLAKLLVESKTHGMELERLVDIRTSEIRESKDRLRMLEDNLPDSYLYQLEARQHRFIYLSAGVERVHGLSRDDILQDAGYLFRQIGLEQLSDMAAAEAVSLKCMSDFEMEIRIQRPDSECRWLQLRSRPRRRLDGEVVWDGMAMDITDRREAEAALRDERDFSNTLLNSLPGVFYLYGEDLHFLRWNKNFERVLGYSYEEIARLSPLDLFVGDDKKLVAERIQKVFDQGEAEVEAGFVSKDGTKTPYYFTGRRTLIGDRVCLLGVGFDISERKRLEEQLLHSQKMDAIGQLAGGVAHDFNNILQVIMGYSNVLMMRGNLGDKQREAVEQIAASTEKASQLTRGLLAFSRKQVVDLKMANLNDIVQHVQKLLVRIIGEDIRLKIIINDPLLPIKADSSQVEQILMNLATNARDAMSKGGILTIETGLQVIDAPFEHAHGYGKPGRYALITVSDTGSGMNEETRTKLFEPFYTGKEVGKGTGLGMSIVYGLVKQHNGYINVYSEIGYGTVVRIYIPLAEIDRIEFPEKAKKVIPQGGDETILLVEDDAGVRKLISSVLTEFGYGVIEAEDGVEAVETFGKNREKIRLILMDLIMPRKNGMEAYKEICRIQPGVQVLYLSGYTSDFIQSRGVVEEGIELIMKPVQPTELLLKVREMLDGSAGTIGRRESSGT